MKTIEVSDELYAKLIELSENINSQDNRGTATPYFFQIKTNEKRRVAEGCGTECWAYDGSTIETEKEINQAVADWLDEDVESVKSKSEYEKEGILEKAGWQRMNYDYEEKFQNAFLTEKSCKEHIKRNGYHYVEPSDYLMHAFRNPDLELVFEFLGGLTEKKIRK